MKAHERPSVVLHIANKINAFIMQNGKTPQGVILGTATYRRFEHEASRMLVKSDGTPIQKESVGRFQGVDLYVANDIDIMVQCVGLSDATSNATSIRRRKRAAQ